jgi:cation transporter-like permease
MSIPKGIKPILLTGILLAAAFVVFFAIDIGFIVALVLGVRTKKPSVVWFSIIANSIFFVLLSGVMFLLAIANGISEP